MKQLVNESSTAIDSFVVLVKRKEKGGQGTRSMLLVNQELAGKSWEQILVELVTPILWERLRIF
jgi:hypothetical protein